MSRYVSFIVLIGVILLTGFFFYRVMASFILPLFLAVLAVVIFQPVFRWMNEQLNQRRRLAAALTTALIMLVVLLPTGGILTLATVEGTHLVSRMDAGTLREKSKKLRNRIGLLKMPHAEELRAFENTLDQVTGASQAIGGDRPPQPIRIDLLLERLDDLGTAARATTATSSKYDELSDGLVVLATSEAPPPGSLDFEASLQSATARYRDFKIELLGGPVAAWIKEATNPTDEDLRHLSGQIFLSARGWLLRVGGETSAFAVRLVIGVVIMIVSIYFFFVDGPEMVTTFMRLSPLDDRYEAVLLDEFESISRAVVLASLLSAVVQGLLGGLGYWLSGMHAVILLTVLTTVLAMVPFVGTAVVWLPAAAWLYFYEERTGAAVFLMLYGALVVSMADNIIKPWVLHGQSKLHPLLALLSVLGGVKALGPVGIVVGPMAVVFLQTLLNLLHRELVAMDRSSDPREMPVSPAMESVGQPSAGPATTPTAKPQPSPPRTGKKRKGKRR